MKEQYKIQQKIQQAHLESSQTEWDMDVTCARLEIYDQKNQSGKHAPACTTKQQTVYIHCIHRSCVPTLMVTHASTLNGEPHSILSLIKFSH